MDRAEKQAELDSLKKDFSDSEIAIVSHNKGMTVAQVTKLRGEIRASNGNYKVSKNTLAKIALKGSQFEDIGELLAGPTAITTSSDPLAAAKAIYNFAKTSGDKLVILGGYFAGQKLDAAAVEKLAKLPTLNEIRGKLVGLIQAPAAQLARLAQAYATKDQEASS